MTCMGGQHDVCGGQHKVRGGQHDVCGQRVTPQLSLLTLSFTAQEGVTKGSVGRGSRKMLLCLQRR